MQKCRQWANDLAKLGKEYMGSRFANKTIVSSLLMAWLMSDGAIDLFPPWLYDWIMNGAFAAIGGSAAHHVAKGNLKSA